MSQQPLEPELTALERELALLEPSARVDRDAILYRAGRASTRPSRLWPALAAVSTVAACVLGVLLLRQALTPTPTPTVVERIIHVPAPPEPTPGPSTPDTSPPAGPDAGPTAGGYLRQREQVLRWGPDVLHTSPGGAGGGGTLTPADAPRAAPGPVIPNFLKLIPFLGGTS